MCHLNKYIANIFKAYVKDENNNDKNSTTIPNTSEMFPMKISNGISYLHTNIHMIDTLNIIKDYVNHDDQFTRKTAIAQEKSPDLFKVVLATTCYTFNSQFYQQTYSVAMGGPASLTTAEIYMQTHKQIAISRVLNPPKISERFACDVSSILKRTQLKNVLHQINKFHQNIKFTM